ncbi:MAG: NADH-quinone oxidoreductase subunit H [Phycisphaerales bacterium]|nr:NADH-quinone oxidoreductase subunit H [Phycisphaerales bacterium]
MLDWIQANIPPWLPLLLVVHLVVLVTVAYLILLERKSASWMQDRLGPNRVGPYGLLQPLADGLKFFLKEDYRARSVDKVLFTLAPVIMIVVIIISIAVIPWGGIKGTTQTVDITNLWRDGHSLRAAVDTQAKTISADLPRFHELISDVTVQTVPAGAGLDSYPGQPTVVLELGNDLDPVPAIDLASGQRLYATFTTGWRFQIANLNIGVLFILATLSLAVYGVVIGGWASNNKYSFLGGLRATANMISYEVPMGLAIVTIVLMFGTLDLNQIVEKQAHYWGGWLPAWNVFAHPVTFLLFLVCIHAEANRAPFDTAEAEQELVGGYHTEYSSMRFALFFMAEYAGMVTTSALMVALFLGGWHFPGLGGPDAVNPAVTDSLSLCILRAVVYFAKTIFVLFLFMWVRWTLPRFRFDQILALAWRGLIPIALAILLSTALTIYFFGSSSAQFVSLRRLDGWMALVMFGVNVVVLGIVMYASTLLPIGPSINRRVRIPGSRYNTAALPKAPAAMPAAGSASS